MARARIISASEAIQEPAIRARWEELLDQCSGATQYYQSPGYFDHLARWNPDDVFLAVIEGDAGAPVGIVPLRKARLSLAFESRDDRVVRVAAPSIQILGGSLLLPQSPQVFELLIRQIADSFPDCRAIAVNALSTSSPLWDFLSDARPLSREFMLYVPNGLQFCHTMRVPPSLDEYFGAFNRKRRYNLRRQVGRLDRFGNGSLKLQRIDHVSHVRHLHNARVALAGHATQPLSMVGMPEIQLHDLAERGLLLSYVLSVNGKPCGLGFGTRFRDTLCMHSFLHDTAINNLSPGTVLQTLMMQDVIDFKLAQRIDYGFGASRYRLLNELDTRVTAFLMRRSMLNKVVLNAHRTYSRAKTDVKRLLHRASPAAAEGNAGQMPPGTRPAAFRRLLY